jgi:hypothetical protein
LVLHPQVVVVPQRVVLLAVELVVILRVASDLLI